MNNNLELANMNLQIKIQQLELENKILREKISELTSKPTNIIETEISKVISFKKPSIKDLIEEVEAMSLNDEMKEELTIYKPIASLSEKNKKVLIALWKYNGLTIKQLHELVLQDIEYQTNVYKVMYRLNRHVRKRDGVYYSRYNFGARHNEGYVYVIKEFHTYTYKIGKARNLDSRLKLFNVKLPFEWELVASFKFKDYTYGEKLMHELFNDKRIGETEWFDLSEDDLKMINNQHFPNEIRDLIVG